MENKNVQAMVWTIESLLKAAKVSKTSKKFIYLSIGERDEKVTVTYDRKYHCVIVSMVMFDDYCCDEVKTVVAEKAKEYDEEHVTLTDLRRQKEELERRIADLEQHED